MTKDRKSSPRNAFHRAVIIITFAAIVAIGTLMFLTPNGASENSAPPAKDLAPPVALTSVFQSDAKPAVVDYGTFIAELNAGRLLAAAVSDSSRWVIAQGANGNVIASDVPTYTGSDSPHAGLPNAFELPNALADTNVAVVNPARDVTAQGGGIPRFLMYPIMLALIFATIIVIIAMVRRSRGLSGPISGAGGGAAAHGRMKKGALTVTPATRFTDVAGCDECIEELRETVEFLTNPARFTALGARMPRGVILHGPPGTGKTLLAKAVAGESGVPFYAISGSDFVDTYVGVGASRVRDLFAQMRAHEHGAVLFVDEIDAIGRARGANKSGSDSEREGTLNALLVELDGFGDSDRIVVLAATNRLELLDSALTRPGRFDRHVQVALPAEAGRRQILSLYAAGKPLSNLDDLDEIASCTSGFSGADLSKLMNEAAIMAARDSRPIIEMADLQEGMLRAIAGPERKDRPLADGELERIAWHEAGHALAAELCPTHPKTQRVSIAARGNAAGLALYGRSDASLMSPEQLHEKMVVVMAGRAAEHIVFGEVSSGAANDLEQVNTMARVAVERYGFSEHVGQLITGTASADIPMSAQTRVAIDTEVARLVENAYADAVATLSANRETLDRIANVLLARQTIDRRDLMELVDGLVPAAMPQTPLWRPAPDLTSVTDDSPADIPRELAPRGRVWSRPITVNPAAAVHAARKSAAHLVNATARGINRRQAKRSATK